MKSAVLAILGVLVLAAFAQVNWQSEPQAESQPHAVKKRPSTRMPSSIRFKVSKENSNGSESFRSHIPSDIYSQHRIVMDHITEPSPGIDIVHTRVVEMPQSRYPFLRIQNRYSWNGSMAVQEGQEIAVADHILVQLKSGKSRTDLEEFLSQYPDFQVRREIPKSGIFLISFDLAKSTLEDASADLSRLGGNSLFATVDIDISANLF